MCEHDEYRKEIKARSDRFLAYLGKAAEDELLERFDRLHMESSDLEVPADMEERLLNMIHDL